VNFSRDDEEKGVEMKKLSLVFAVLVLVMAPLMASADEATVLDLVDKAAALWKDKGKDYTLKVLNASAGPLRKGSLYVFACDFKGRILAHPAQQDLRGQDQWELQDAKGRFLTQEFLKVAQSPEGFGWVEYDWMRVNETTPTKKRAYIKRIPGQDVFLGSGYYVK
jgi:cytochrome c